MTQDRPAAESPHKDEQALEEEFDAPVRGSAEELLDAGAHSGSTRCAIRRPT